MAHEDVARNGPSREDATREDPARRSHEEAAHESAAHADAAPGNGAHRAAARRAGEGLDAAGQEAEDVITALLTASRLLIAVSARALAASGTSLSLPQLRALVVLFTHGPVKLAAMAETLAVNPSTAMRTVDRLAPMGLIDRRTNAGNRREVVLSLTDPGQQLVEEVLAHRRAEITALVDRLPAERRAGLVPALRSLTEVAEVHPDPAEFPDGTGFAPGSGRPRKAAPGIPAEP